MSCRVVGEHAPVGHAALVDAVQVYAVLRHNLVDTVCWTEYGGPILVHTAHVYTVIRHNLVDTFWWKLYGRHYPVLYSNQTKYGGHI